MQTGETCGFHCRSLAYIKTIAHNRIDTSATEKSENFPTMENPSVKKKCKYESSLYYDCIYDLCLSSRPICLISQNNNRTN